MLKLYKYEDYKGWETVYYLIVESTKENVLDILKPLVDKRIYLSDISEQDTDVQFSKSGIIDILTIDNPNYND
jgi:hypothetical protein